MDEGTRRRVAALKTALTGHRASARSATTRLKRRSTFAVLLALAAVVAVTAGAHGASQTGGVVGGEDQGPVAKKPKACANHGFGRRSLRMGDCGEDVKTLTWLLRSKSFGQGVKASKRFGKRVDGGVRALQRQEELKASGIANKRTRSKLLGTMKRYVASWYGPGLWGNTLACGGRLGHGTVGVAHKTLKCGTPVVLRLGDRFLRTRVIDRGPFIAGRTWDLTQRAARKLGMTATSKIYAAVSR